MLNLKFIHTLLLLTAFTGAACAQPAPPLQGTELQSTTLKEVVKKLSTRHYRDQKIDDTLSQQFFDKYLNSLDVGRMYFLQSDITSFERYRNQFDDDFKAGNLENGFAIYGVLRQRMETRLTSVIKTLSDTKKTYEFTTQESVEIDREKAPWPKTAAEADQLWDQRIRLSLLNLKLAGKSLEKSIETVRRRYEVQLKRIQQQTNEDIFEAYVNALTQLYDPHTNYFSPRASENFDIGMRLSVEGIGAELRADEENTKVVRLVPGGPAARQGQLKPGDKIIGVGQGKDSEVTDVIGWRLDEVVELIRGKKNTQVKLEVTSSDSQKKQIIITRDTVKLEDQAAQKGIFEVKDGTTTRKVGVIYLPTFYIDMKAAREGNPNYRSTTRDVARLVGELQKEHVDGIIMDLRNNGGGSLQEATQLTGLFIDPGIVVQIRDANGQVHRDNRTYGEAMYRGPLVVLINRLSASASEIFAGAIQDYGRGLVIGSQSFGKGSVQSLTDLPAGELKLTESKFYRVSGDSTQHRGVIPDIEMPNLVDHEDVGESTYDTALQWDQIRPASHEHYYDFSPLLPGLRTLQKQHAANNPSFVLLEDQINLSKEFKNKKTISLNEKTREQEKTDMETKTMQLENKRRKAQSEAEYKNLAEYRAAQKAEEEKAEKNEAVREPKIDPKKDAILTESGFLLVNFAKQLSQFTQNQAANF